MPSPEKVKNVAELTDKISEAKSILLTDYTGLNVEEISGLRNLLRESSVEYRIVKNTLTKISVENLGLNQIIDFLQGPTAIAFGLKDPISSVKIISEYYKKNNKPVIKACFFDGQLFESAQVEELAKLPGQEILRAKLLGTIGAPLSNFVFLMKNVLQQTVFVLNAIKEKKEQEG